MKKALVLSLVALFAFGVASFGTLSGYWSTNVTIDPGAADFGDFFTAMNSVMKVDYALSDWTFGSISSFDKLGYSAQSFSVAGALGAFTIASAMTFDPAFVTVKDYGAQTLSYGTGVQTGSLINYCPLTYTEKTTTPQMLKWTTTLGVSIAGVSFEALVIQDYHNAVLGVTLEDFLWYNATTPVQTDSKTMTSYLNGMGMRLKVGGSFGAVNVSSYTYFNLNEAEALTTNGLTIAKKGSYSIAVAGCDFTFTEQYVLFEGFTFGCVSLDVGLEIDCTGFDHITFLVKDIIVSSWLDFDFQITFTTATKTVTTEIDLVTPVFDCIVLEVGIGSAAVGVLNSTNVVDQITIHGFKLEQTWAGIKFTSITELDAASKLLGSGATTWNYINGDTQLGFLVPFVGDDYLGVDIDDVASDYWEVKCVATERYRVWESFAIDVDGDTCCGGLLDLTMTTYFGEHQVLNYYGYVTYIEDLAYAAGTLLAAQVPNSFATLYGTLPLFTDGTVYTAITGTTYKNNDGVKIISAYKAGAETTLFDWVKTSVDLGVGIGTNIELDFGFDISAFGWESLDVGFKWSF